jgi:SAM-dependent methyltransferase
MKCPICDDKSGFKFKSHLNKNVYQCVNIKCKHLFVEGYKSSLGICDRGEDLSLSKLKNDRDIRIKTYGERNKLMFNAIYKKLQLKQDCNVLDFGSGDGNLICSLKSVYPNTKVTCIEPHEVFSLLLSEVADKTVDSPDRLDTKFDLIVLNEVIEHLNDPVEEMKKLANVLKASNAAIYIATPLGETHYNSNFTGAFDTDSHLHFFTRKSLNLCLIKSGLTPLDTDDIDQPLYSTLLEHSAKAKLKYWIRKSIIKRFLKLNKRFCLLHPEHISGLCYKN